MTRLDWGIVAFGAFLCYVMATAVVDEPAVRDGISTVNGMMQLQEVGRRR